MVRIRRAFLEAQHHRATEPREKDGTGQKHPHMKRNATLECLTWI